MWAIIDPSLGRTGVLLQDVFTQEELAWANHFGIKTNPTHIQDEEQLLIKDKVRQATCLWDLMKISQHKEVFTDFRTLLYIESCSEIRGVNAAIEAKFDRLAAESKLLSDKYVYY